MKELECMAQDLAMKGYAQSTQKRYLQRAQHLLARFGRAASELSREDLRQYVEELGALGKSGSWLNNELCALLFLYRKTLGHPEHVSFISFARVRSPVPQVLSLAQVQALLNAIKVPRYQAIAMVLYGSGLRIHEAISLQVHDIDGERGVIHIRCGKGGRAREAKLSPSLYSWLREYWARQRPESPYLFASRSGQLPRPVTIREALRKAAEAAYIKKRVTPHVLRHSFATHLLEQGVDVHVVSALLGHASLKSTTRYARVTRKLIRQTPSPLELLPRRRM